MQFTRPSLPPIPLLPTLCSPTELSLTAAGACAHRTGPRPQTLHPAIHSAGKVRALSDLLTEVSSPETLLDFTTPSPVQPLYLVLTSVAAVGYGTGVSVPCLCSIDQEQFEDRIASCSHLKSMPDPPVVTRKCLFHEREPCLLPKSICLTK